MSPKSSTSSRRYVVLKTLAGVRSPEKLETDLLAAMGRHKNEIDEVRRQNEAREAQRVLRSSQDAAYLSALEADRKKQEEEARRQEEAEKAKEAAELEAALSLSQKLEEETALARKKKELPPEPVPGPGICTFVFRLPDGSRLNRRFTESEKLENVFTYLDVTLAADNGQSGTIKNYAFTAYPHRRFSRESTDLSVSLSDAKLTGRVAVFVQNLDA